MKKLLVIALVLLMTLSLAACGNGNESITTADNDNSSAPTSTPTTELTTAPTSAPTTEPTSAPDNNTAAPDADENWPDNEFTKLVPQPAIPMAAATTTEKSFSVKFTDATNEKITAYIELVKVAGFNLHAETELDFEMGMDQVTFHAQNEDGWSIVITYTLSEKGLKITKP